MVFNPETPFTLISIPEIQIGFNINTSIPGSEHLLLELLQKKKKQKKNKQASKCNFVEPRDQRK